MAMTTAIEFIADRLPRVTEEDVRRFADTVEIRDALLSRPNYRRSSTSVWRR